MTTYSIWGQGAVSAALDSSGQGDYGTFFNLSESAALTGIWWYSHSGATVLPSACAIYQVTGVNTGTLVSGTENDSPSWSGEAGSGWVKCTYDGSVTLDTSQSYCVVVYGGTGSAGFESYTVGYDFPVTNGIISAPAAATPGGSANGPFENNTELAYPDSISSGISWWVDVEVSTGGGGGTVTATGTLEMPAMAMSSGSNVPYITGLTRDETTGGWWSDQNGNPRFLLMDNPWALIVNAGEWNGGDWESDISTYLAGKQAQGYTGCYVAALGCIDIGGSYENGNTWDNVSPFVSDGDPSTGLNDDYWERVDYLISEAETYGITILLNIAYTANGTGNGNFDAGGALDSSVMTETQYTNYGTAVANRYIDSPNLIWVYGNDYYAVNEAQFEYIRSAIVGTGDTHVMAVHNYPESTSRYDVETSSGAEIGSAFSYDHSQVNWVYTYNATYFGLELAYKEAATHDISQIPAMWGDGYFVYSGVDILPETLMRQMFWWAVSSGARGVTSTSNDIWSWSDVAPGDESTENWYSTIAPALVSVVTGLDGWHKLMPDTASALVTAGRGTHGSGITTGSNYEGGTDDYVSAAITPDGTLAVIYSAAAMDITIDESQMVDGYMATWVDPVTGAMTGVDPASTYNSSTQGNNSAGDPDWVLILAQPPTSSAGTGSIAMAPMQMSGSVSVARPGAVTFRLMDGADGRPGDGPSTGTSFSGVVEVGVAFTVSEACWLEGFWWWVCDTGQDTAAQTFALWQVGSESSELFVPAASATSGTLTAGQWNYIELDTPVPLSINAEYLACTGWTAAHGYPQTQNQFGDGDPYSAGIINGPLTAYSDTSGSNPRPSTIPQMPFGTAGADPTVYTPELGDESANLWIDVQVTTDAPVNSSFRIWPSYPDVVQGAAYNGTFILATAFSLTEASTVNKIWFQSPAALSVYGGSLPSRCSIWDVETETVVAGTDNTSPAWKKPDGSDASQGDGYVYCDYSGSGVTLEAGKKYKVSVYNAQEDNWLWVDVGYWAGSREGANGFTYGPLVVPNNADSYDGQSTYAEAYSYPNVNPDNGENYYVDIEVTPQGSSSGLLLSFMP